MARRLRCSRVCGLGRTVMFHSLVRSTMKRGRRTGVIAAASAVLIAATLIAPAAAAADPTSPTGSESAGASKVEPADPDGPQGPGRSPVAGLDDRAGRDNPDSIYRAGKTDGFQPLTDDSLSDTAAEKLGNADTRLLQQAQASKKKSVTVLMLARKGATEDVVAAVEKAGGTVGSVTGKVGYVRATVPTDSVTTLAGLRSVAAIDLNRTYKIPGPDLGAAGARTAATKAAGPTAPGANTPADNPYLPINETNAEAFVKDNPAWDGRGTVVGVLDTGVDVEHPALQTTSDGKPKIVDWVTETDPVTDRDGSWVRMSTTKTGPTFSYLGKTWTIPEGTFQFGVFYEGATAGSDFEGDLNRDGDTLDFYGVLYDPTTHRIWVDGNNNQDLTDETPMAPFAVDRQVGHFGSDDPATPQNERIPFVVEYRDNVDLSPLGGSNVGKTANYVSIGLPVASHGTHVAGITAGTSMFGGRMHGAAPGAQIVSARACTWGGGCTQAALTEGMIDLVTNRHVDVVNLSIGGLPALNDGSDVIAALYDKLIDNYDVQIVIAAGNDGLGTNTVSSPSVAGKAISVAASVSSDTWWADYGSKVATKQGIFGFSSRGPAENGALAPQVSAPGAAISSIPMWLSGEAVPEAGYSLPAGYGMANGTSMAAPQVAGAAALLLSAAKAHSLTVSPAALKTALTGTADPIPGVPTVAQGAGIIDTVAAWKQLSAGINTNELTVSAPVCSSLSGLLATPNTGVGIYNRCLPTEGGQVTGAQKTYKVSVTRTSGAAGNVVHRIGWIGNDGTFSARAAMPLQLGKAADITVTATATTSGMHSAILTIDDPATGGIDQFVAVTVLATKPLAKPDYSVTSSGTLDRTGTTSLLVPVPKGVEALQLTLGGLADGSQVRALPIDPDGMPADSNASYHCYTNYTDPANCNATARPVYRPKPGIWEFVIESRRTSPVEQNPYTAKVSLQGMSFDPGTVTVDKVTMNSPTNVRSTGKNTFGPAIAHVATGEIGDVRNLFSTVSQGEITSNMLYVPRQTTRIDVTLTPRDAADLDFYVYFNGMPIDQSTTTGDSPEHIVIGDPQPGTYFIVVAGVAVPGDNVTFDYHQEMYSKGLGTITPKSDAKYTVATGQSMPVDGAMMVSARQLTKDPMAGRVRVANEYGTIIGAADVTIAAVDVPKLDLVAWAPPFVGAALNESGVVAGDRQYNARMTPTIWTAADGFTNLDLAGGRYGSALDLNDGQIAVGIATDSALHTLPAQWAKDGSLTVLGVPDWRPYSNGYATSVNNKEVVTGFSEAIVKESDGKNHSYSDGFVRTPDGTFSKLAHLSSDLTVTQPRAINDAGMIVGASHTDDHVPHAVAWDATSGAIQDLGTLPGQHSAQANDVNASGTVVGTSGDDAFVWTKAGGMQRLADYGYNATGEKVTDDGWILGTVELFPDVAVSAMWDPQGRLWDLSGMVPLSAGDRFTPTYSFDINDRHQLMVYGEGGPNAAWSSSVMLRIPAGLGD
ncbi:S8 family serine peptidase [Streptomyces sp. NPDC060286]|uniref:S8 family serine peptidase n=1 Tax=unclassified Streptomyces TaxID=2593676 RepID=UPI0035DBB7D0